ncbi:HlyD family secretion protein [Bradyrhizobium elkanii]|uniref:HlyD family secretion protein n=1 Tax=Bradyrhizobium elkanii TaxID=29448 RepID=UPI001BAD9CD0|nr:HlyD family secretion protein [Bradyrhizobium elkanii]
MIAVLTIVYVAIVLVLFKVLRINPTAYLIAGLIVAGVLMIGAVVVAWMQSAPITQKLVTSQYVVQLVPYVKGQVKQVYAKANQPMKRGDLLLEIDPIPYQYAVDQLEAQLKVTKANIEQAKASEMNARASLARAKAADQLAKTQEQMTVNVYRNDPAAVSQLTVDQVTQQRQEADAAVDQAEAAVLHAVSVVAAAESTVPGVEAQLGEARFNLTQCKVTTPADGYVVNWQVQVGTMVAPAPIAAFGTFVDTSSIEVLALFPQNYLTNVRRGDDVELVLDPYPGKLFTGKVDAVISAAGGGQLDPSGNIPSAVRSTGAYAVKILFDDEEVARKLSIGSGGSAAIYTSVGRPVHIISKVTMRMKKWLLFVLPSVESAGT